MRGGNDGIVNDFILNPFKNNVSSELVYVTITLFKPSFTANEPTPYTTELTLIAHTICLFPFFPAYDKDGKECFCIRRKGVDKVINGSKEFIGEFGGINLAFNELKRQYDYLAISEKLIKIMEE